MSRPQKLPLKKLKAHIGQLKKKHSLHLKWSTFNPHHNEIKRIVYVPFIYSFYDYLVCLHEIGHALTPTLRHAGDRFFYLSRASKRFNRVIGTSATKEDVNILNRLNNITHRLHKEVDSLQWLWSNEFKVGDMPLSILLFGINIAKLISEKPYIPTGFIPTSRKK